MVKQVSTVWRCLQIKKKVNDGIKLFFFQPLMPHIFNLLTSLYLNSVLSSVVGTAARVVTGNGSQSVVIFCLSVQR